MSTRALRRAMNRQTSGADDKDALDGSEDEEEVSTTKKNPFDLLALEDLDIDDEGMPSDDDTGEKPSTKEAQKNNSVNTAGKKKKQKKKRNRKEADKENGVSIEPETEEFDLDSYAQKVAEERKRMQELSSEDGATASRGTIAERAIISVDHRCLDADYEMARVFGNSFVRSEASKRITGRMPGAGLVRPKAQWPIASQIGLSMRKADDSGDTGEGMWFVMEHNKEYRAVEEKFHEALHSHNPNNLQEIFRRQPYHVNTLLQMSDVFRMEEDYDTSADLTERAVFAFTRSAHPLFNVSSGRCLLDYRCEENRGFFVALFMHIQFLGRRGCYRTGLEFCKVLLSLNPKKDPLAAILMIDHYSIMSGELEYLLRFFREWQTYKNLNQLPNFMFSCALAQFRLKEKVKDSDGGNSMLQDALLRYPGWLPILLEKCGISPDDRVAKSDFFNRNTTESEGLVRLYGLHVGRTCHCWKEPRTVRWVETNVATVLDIVDAGDDNRIKEYVRHRSRRYRETPTSVLRHIFLSSIPGVTLSLPAHSESQSISSYDPLPPKDSITLYPRPVRRRRAQMEDGFLRPFFNSFLPTYDPQEEGHEAAGGARAQRSEEILEAIRQLLAGIQPNPPPVANGQNAEDVEED